MQYVFLGLGVAFLVLALWAIGRQPRPPHDTTMGMDFGLWMLLHRLWRRER